MACRANSMRHQGLNPIILGSLNVAAEQIAEKVVYFVIPSEARNLSSVLTQRKEREIPRFARNDKRLSFSAACESATHKDQPKIAPDLPPQPPIQFPDHARNYHGR